MCEYESITHKCLDIEGAADDTIQGNVNPECIAATETDPCEYFMLQDTHCTPQCNIPQCNFDNGQCEDTESLTKYTCDASLDDGKTVGGACFCNMLGDGTCDPECNTDSCALDAGDCCDPIFSTTELIMEFDIWEKSDATNRSSFNRLTANSSATVKRYMGGVNRILGGILVLQGKRHLRGTCQEYPGLDETCVQSERQFSATSYGINPVFVLTSSLANEDLFPKIGTIFSSENGDLNEQGLPYGFKYEGEGDLAGFPIYFDTNIDNARANALLQYMREGVYIDHDTDDVKVKTLTYNADEKVFLYSEITFFFTTGGRTLLSHHIQVRMYFRGVSPCFSHLNVNPLLSSRSVPTSTLTIAWM
jgi:hypothetical protein